MHIADMLGAAATPSEVPIEVAARARTKHRPAILAAARPVRWLSTARRWGSRLRGVDLRAIIATTGKAHLLIDGRGILPIEGARMNRARNIDALSMKPFLVLLFLLLLAMATAAHASCGATTFQPISPFIPPGTTHNAYFLTDPAGQQRAVFDLAWGGALTALTYNGASLLWGNATGGTVEPVMHASINGQDYQPTLAGEVRNHGTQAVGVLCGSNMLYIMSGGLLDFNDGVSGHISSGAVANDTTQSNAYATPYTVVTAASFVSNPSGTPAYYLQLQQTITNIDPFESLNWSLELVGYGPFSLSTYSLYPPTCTAASPCAGSTTPQLLGGLYPNGNLRTGVAFYVSPHQNWPAQSTYVAAQVDNSNRNQSVHLTATNWSLPPSTSQTVAWYILAGDWAPALTFAQGH